MKRSILMATAALALAGSFVSAAQAAPILNLFNTGVDANGAKLEDGAADLHYLLNGSDTPYAYNNGAYYQASDAGFIAATMGGGYTQNPNVYTLQFSLEGLNADTASISGFFAADNAGTVYLNGTALASTMDFQNLTSFSANSGFLVGQNQLSFEITDFGQPSAFLVSGLSGTAEVAAAVPETATWAMMLAGFGMIGFAARRRQSVKTTVAYA